MFKELPCELIKAEFDSTIKTTTVDFSHSTFFILYQFLNTIPQIDVINKDT